MRVVNLKYHHYLTKCCCMYTFQDITSRIYSTFSTKFLYCLFHCQAIFCRSDNHHHGAPCS